MQYYSRGRGHSKAAPKTSEFVEDTDVEKQNIE